MNVPDGITFDFPHARIEIAGRGFPAVVMTYADESCKAEPCDGCELFGSFCVLGGGVDWNVSWAVYVPTENGILCEVEYQHTDDLLSLHLYSRAIRKVSPRLREIGDPSRGPVSLMVAAGERRIVPWAVHGGPWYWERCEPDWLADQIARLSTFEHRPLPAPHASLVPISDLRVRPKGTVLL